MSGHGHRWSAIGDKLRRCCVCDVFGAVGSTRKWFGGEDVADLICACGKPATVWVEGETVGPVTKNDARAKCKGCADDIG